MIGIFGSARDGSTLLMRLLDGSPELWVYPIEIKFFNQLMGRRELVLRRRLPRTTKRATLSCASLGRYAHHQLSELHRHYASQIDGVPLPALEVDPLPPDVYLRYGEALRWFLSLSARGYGAGSTRTLAFKTTEALEVALYESAIDGLRSIHIVRDPLEQFESTKRTVVERPGFLYWYPDGAEVTQRFVRRWRAHCGHALRGAANDPSSHLIVHYEDLRREPRGELQRVTEWLGVAPPADPEAQTVLGGRRLVRLPDNPSKAGVATPERVVADMASRYGYERVATDAERAQVARSTAGLARALGYDLSTTRAA